MYDKKKPDSYINKMEEKKAELENVIEDAEEMIIEMNKFSDYLVNHIKSNDMKSKLKEISKDTGNKKIDNKDEENNIENEVKYRFEEKVDEIAGYRAEVKVDDRIDDSTEVKQDVRTEDGIKPGDRALEKEEYYVNYRVTDEIEKEEGRTKFKVEDKIDITDKKVVIADEPEDKAEYKTVKNFEKNASNFDAVRIDFNNNNSQENNVYTIKDIIKNAAKNTTKNSTIYAEQDTAENAVEDVLQNTQQNTLKNNMPLNLKSKQREVLKLANEGLSDTEIAKRLNIGKGEVQLILGLNR